MTGENFLDPITIAYMNGEASYPNKRIMYPENPGDEENAWIAGYNAAMHYANIDLEGSGIDNFLWNYKTGE